VDPALITVVKGEPTADELAALVSVLVALTTPQPADDRPTGRPWRGAAMREHSWLGPTSWSSGPRRWTRTR
jgi:hypothetical protein